MQLTDSTTRAIRRGSAANAQPRCAVVRPARGSRLHVRCEAVEEKQQTLTAPAKAPEAAPAPAPAPVPIAPEAVPLPAPDRPSLPWPKRRAWASVALDKLLDTVDDVALHVRRHTNELPAARALEQLVRRGKDGRLRLDKKQLKKPVVLVLGSGWGAHSLIKVVDTELFEVVCVSPRNHFLFTPMLPSTAVGTVEFRSLLEPIRTSNPFVDYLEAGCDKLDVANKVAYCTSSVAFEDGRRPQFEIAYDIAVVAVGEAPATFGVPGVAEHCYFMKEVSDCVGLRKRIQEAFELAALPGTSEAERQRVLHFVVVGGGPTGVEFAGTLNDFVRQDLRKKYPELMPYVRVTLLQSAQSILTQFGASLQQRALDNFASVGVDVRLGVRVVEVSQDTISLKSGEKLDYGVCVWSTGNTSRPLVRDIISQVEVQQQLNGTAPVSAHKLGVDPYLRVVGAKDLIALGDCAMLLQDRLPATAQVAGQQGAYAARLINRGFSLGVGGLDTAPPLKVLDEATVDEREARTLKPVDLKSLSAKQRLTELDLLAALNNDSTYLEPQSRLAYYRKPFEFLSLGIMAYVGNDKALTQVEAFDISVKLYGALAFLLWRSVYITKQVSFRNRVLILLDWWKAQVFGRDLSQF